MTTVEYPCASFPGRTEECTYMDVVLSDNDNIMGFIAAINAIFFHIWYTKLIIIPYAFKWEKVYYCMIQISAGTHNERIRMYNDVICNCRYSLP